MSVAIRPLTGSEILKSIDDLARLRMTVFAEWPYLYEGDPEYEERYLSEFVTAPDSLLVAGRASAMPFLTIARRKR